MFRGDVFEPLGAAATQASPPRQAQPKTLHHRGFGKFVVDGDTIELTSKMP
jgi:hypothetical protein